jgi:hypothetical protein
MVRTVRARVFDAVGGSAVDISAFSEAACREALG